MNKKFFTLIASAMVLSGSFNAVAQSEHKNDGEIPYRTQLTKAANLDPGLWQVGKIDQTQWYQLVVQGETGIYNPNGKLETFVLTQERNYKTGELYLAAKPIQEATLTHSLWKIVPRWDNTAGGFVFSYINKETGYPLTLDHSRAYTYGKEFDETDFVLVDDLTKGNGGNAVLRLNGLEPTVLDGCNDEWRWYSDDDVSNYPIGNYFEQEMVYSYFHGGDSIMAMVFVGIDGAGTSTAWDGFGAIDAPAAGEGRSYIAAVKAHKSELQSLTNANFKGLATMALVTLQPVAAGAKVLNAAEVNSMIDADGSYSYFTKADTHRPNYTIDDYTAKAGNTVKFTVLDPDSKSALTVYNNPLAGNFTAEESRYRSLHRTKHNNSNTAYNVSVIETSLAAASRTKFGGYNVLFKTKGTANKYLKVSEELYEVLSVFGQNSNKITSEPYAYRVDPPTGSVGGINSAIDEVFPSEVPDGTELDAVQGRYHWKVTYYATNDSVVLEPLNASRMMVKEMEDGTDYEDSHVGDAAPRDFLNTVNTGVAYAATLTARMNSAYNKAVNVPFALLAVNWAPAAADAEAVLTVGAPNNVDPQYPVNGAVSKWDNTVLEYNKIEYNYFGTDGVYNFNPATTAYTIANNNPAYVTNRESATGSGNDYQAQMLVLLRFGHEYTTLKRATWENGLYFIQLVTKNGGIARQNGMYLAYNQWGQLMYDSPLTQQNYGDMPATIWVVKQLECTNDKPANGQTNATPRVAVYNREYGSKIAKDGSIEEEYPAFVGQLYVDANGNNYIINHSNPYHPNIASSLGKLPSNSFSCGDTLRFTALSKTTYADAWESKYHGYKFFDEDDLNYEAWRVKYLTADVVENGPDTDKYLNIAEADSFLSITNIDAKAFEIEPLFESKFGYTYDAKAIPQLSRTVYALKVRDNNLIDNNWKYVVLYTDAISHNAYYKMAHIKDVDGVNIKLAKFYFKADQFDPFAAPDADERAFALIDVNRLESTPTFRNGGWLTYNDDLTAVHPWGYDDDYMDATYADRKYFQNGLYRLHIVDVNAKTTFETLNNNPQTRVSAFTFVQEDRPLYLPITALAASAASPSPVTGFNETARTVKIYRERGTDKEYLFEDSENKSGVITNNVLKGFGYLGIGNGLSVKPNAGYTDALYVDDVYSSNPRMPQYLFVVAPDSVADGLFCNESGAHGYFKSAADANAKAHDGIHSNFYNGYLAGRVLVNLNDSVDAAINIHKQDEYRAFFKYDNYTRLAFVEGVHMVISTDNTDGVDETGSPISYKDAAGNVLEGEYLFIMKNITLKALRTENGAYTNVIDPYKFQNAINKGWIDINELDGKHQNYAFSLRYTNDAHQDFLLESKDAQGQASIAGFKGGWVKIHNGVPVLAQTSNVNGDHTAVTPLTAYNMAELINQSQVFRIEATSQKATNVEDAQEAAKIQVIASNGKVTIIGAAGKKVAISNVLGQAVANAYISNDNYSINVPAGIVIVAVDGEKAVKAIVK